MTCGARRALGAVVALAVVMTLSAATANATPRATVARLGRAPGATRVALELPLRIDARGLARFAAAVSTPGSPRYGDYEPVAVLAHRFGASRAARARVLRYLHRAGASGVRIASTGLFAEATMRVSAAERRFGVALDRFHANATATSSAADYLAPTGGRTARIPMALRGVVTGVVGLDTRPLATTASPAAAPRGSARPGLGADDASQPPSSGYASRSGTPSGCAAALAKPGFTPNEYLTAYGYGQLQSAGLDGQGERVALIEIDGFRPSDVRAFAACFHLPVPPIHAYGVGIRTALAPGGETTLDLELLDAAAPALKDIDVYESEALPSDVLRSLTDALGARGHSPDVISVSLGNCEADVQAAVGAAGIQTAEATLQLAAATGVSVLAASGDDGSTACVTAQDNPLDQLAVSFPASSPWVSGVGGTNVALAADNELADPATDQVVWNDEPTVFGAAGGGGSMFSRPSYQDGFDRSAHREVPDVSMLADRLPGYDIYCTAAADCLSRASQSPWVSLGGTSAGTPLLAGGFALIDEALRRRGREDLGFANPLLYEVAGSATASQSLSDVVSGSNDITAAVFGRAIGCCTATAGYDEASGLGSVNLAGLAAAARAIVPRQPTVSLRLPSQRRPLHAEHLLARVSCSQACLAGAYARIAIGGSRAVAYSRSYKLRARRSRTIRIGLGAKVRARIRGALAAHRPVVATVYGAIIDASGAVRRHTAGHTLRVTA